ncbi:MAG: DUF397 domain-containing protein [Pseudonocardiaceae bacterium]
MTQDPLAGATWRKSSRSATQGQCVEIAQTPTASGIRDSKNPTGIYLTVTPPQWAGTLAMIKSGNLTPLP